MCAIRYALHRSAEMHYNGKHKHKHIHTLALGEKRLNKTANDMSSYTECMTIYSKNKRDREGEREKKRTKELFSNPTGATNMYVCDCEC